MTYTRHYETLVDRARRRTMTAYSERHHIVPKCMGGSNASENIVRLTPEEHFVAHQLLVKMYPEHRDLIWAATAMTNGTTRRPRRNKLYGWLRRRLAERLSERFTGGTHSDATRAKQRIAKLGKTRAAHSEETKAKMSAASKGRKKSASHVAAMARSKTGVKRGPHSEAHRQRLSESIRTSEKHKASRALANTPAYRALQAARTREVWERRRIGALPYPSHASIGG